jgi:hypothetical protein
MLCWRWELCPLVTVTYAISLSFSKLILSSDSLQYKFSWNGENVGLTFFMIIFFFTQRCPLDSSINIHDHNIRYTKENLPLCSGSLDWIMCLVLLYFSCFVVQTDDIFLSPQSYSLNITTVKGFETFLGSLKARSSHGRSTGVDLVLSCVDNYEARMVVNQVKTCENSISWFYVALHQPSQHFLFSMAFVLHMHGCAFLRFNCALFVFVPTFQACNELCQTWMESGKFKTCIIDHALLRIYLLFFGTALTISTDIFLLLFDHTLHKNSITNLVFKS